MSSLARAATFNLRADTGTLTMPDGRVVPVWGFALGAGPVTVPGPALVLPPGDTTLTINLTNNLPQPVSIVVPGLAKALAPEFDGGSPPRMVSLDVSAAPGGGLQSYTFTGVRPGTFLYESGTDQSAQVQLGLYGAVIARPTVPGQAYDDVSSAYANEIVMVLSEIDPAFHDAVDAGCYEPFGPTDPGCTEVVMSTIDHFPKYFLINGAPYRDPHVPFSAGVAGSTTLIRLLNAGLQTHTMTLQGTRMDVIAQDGNLLRFARRNRVAESIAAGQTLDILIRPPVPGKYAFFDRGLAVTNAGAFPGGLISFIDVAPAPTCAPGFVETRIAMNSDDAHQSTTGAMTVFGTNLQLGSNRIVGLRFANLNIPVGASITNAYVQFEADQSGSVNTSLTIDAQAIDNAPTFASASNNISSRPRTASVAWNPVLSWTAGQSGSRQRTPNIASVIQAVVSRLGWRPGNAIVLMFRGTGLRVAEAYEGGASDAALLRVEYTCPVGGNPGSDDAIHDIPQVRPNRAPTLKADER